MNDTTLCLDWRPISECQLLNYAQAKRCSARHRGSAGRLSDMACRSTKQGVWVYVA